MVPSNSLDQMLAASATCLPNFSPVEKLVLIESFTCLPRLIASLADAILPDIEPPVLARANLSACFCTIWSCTSLAPVNGPAPQISQRHLLLSGVLRCFGLVRRVLVVLAVPVVVVLALAVFERLLRAMPVESVPEQPSANNVAAQTAGGLAGTGGDKNGTGFRDYLLGIQIEQNYTN